MFFWTLHDVDADDVASPFSKLAGRSSPFLIESDTMLLHRATKNFNSSVLTPLKEHL